MRLHRPEQSLKSASNTRKGRSSTSKANRLKHKIIVPSSPGARTPADVSKKGGGTPRPLQCVPLHQKARSHAASPANADRSTKPKPQPSNSTTPSSQPPSSQPLSQEPLDDVTTPDKTVTAAASTYKPIPTAYGGVREQRVKYEHVMLRYGHWDSIRLRVYTYLGITLCASLLSNYILILYAIVVYDTVHENGRPNCPCNVSATHATARLDLGKVDPHNRVVYWRMISGILLGLTSPLLERFLGRRNCLLFFLGLNVVWALILSTQTKYFSDVSMFGLCLGDTFVVFSSPVSLIESLPFHMRVIAPLTIPVANAIGTVFCLLLFEQVALQKICYAAIFLYVVGMILTFFAAEESLCHLIVRNRIEDVQNLVTKYEMEVCEREGGKKKFHQRAAKKIYHIFKMIRFDTDELSIFYFLRRFFKSNVVLETCLACFFAMASGLLDFEMYQSMAELFAGAYVLMCGKLIACVITIAVMIMTRNTHRVKVMSLLQCAILLLLACKKMMLKYDKGNVCSDHQFVARSMFLSAILLSSLIDGLHIVKVAAFLGFGIGGMKDTLPFSLVYLFHLIVGAVALLRMADAVPFSLYLIDLLPLSDRPSYCSTRRGLKAEEESADQKTKNDGVVMQIPNPNYNKDPKQQPATP
ncbi:hypothetical protein PRIPAC_90523 [Pristionchus pacificus]|uniref:Uncharacterized protein n=1 Tax=Pristionchus pacificus TaxID=54126 RepID=A0A2A6B5U1_PRIPA|nr:hypothetical protein PRIPAC_90523 [Pristionchus pacificus]|eukprot:PDM61249.1 hypothetical protein PRIPAC_50691 [Pristionchus pacificus]